ncbi:MAG: thiamine pyrophosphate-binding protein [Actinomycetota bacterium]|nr:thiamine pyrophosphate-binding protein [Actinomycetota bacterium]
MSAPVGVDLGQAANANAGGRTGRFALVEQLLADDIRYLFGNPGTVEQGFLDALADYPAVQYIFALQETVAVAMADGYARASRRPAVVQLHSGVGLGNGIGMMYQAKRGHAPLVVLAGDAGVCYDAMDAQMAADLVGMAQPVTKWAGRVTHPTSLLRMLRRAIKIATTPPMGPVFLALPMDVLDAPNAEEVRPTSILATRTVPEPALVTQAARLLAGAENPIVIVGDGVAFSEGQPELARVAELWGAAVWGADSSEVNLSAAHPHFRGLLGHMFAEDSQPITVQADAVLICGTYVFPEVFPALDGAFAPHARIVHIDLDTDAIAKNFPVDLGLVSDPKLTLARLAESLEREMSSAQKQAAKQRSSRLSADKRREEDTQRHADQARWDEMPMPASRFMVELAELAPDDVVVFDEAITVSPDLVRYLVPTRPGAYFQTRGGSLGVGAPGALGIKLALPERTVFGFTGDGGAMYTIQALWTAAHHQIGAKIVVCNNRSYRILKLNIQQYWQERGLPEHDFPASFDLGGPELRFDRMAESMGVPAVRVETGAQVRPAITRALETDGPFLIDLVIDGDVPGDVHHVKCGQ